MKQQKRVHLQYVVRNEVEHDPEQREHYRAVVPPLFQVTDDQGQVWCEYPVRTPVRPAAGLTWLWPGRIASGQLTVIEGTPGDGKSAVALDWAARVTRGAPFPHVAGAEPVPPASPGPGKVLLVTMQDGFEGTRERLLAQGADPENVCWEMLVEGTTEDVKKCLGQRTVDLPFDIPMLEQELTDQPSIRLVVVDPLCDFCSKPAQVAKVLEKLRNIAASYQVAIVVTLPAEVRFDASGQLRVTSRFRTEAARAVWCVATDPRNADRRLLIPRRTNRFALPQGLAFQIDEQGLRWEETRSIRPRDPLGWEQTICESLTALLRAGPQPAADLWEKLLHRGFSRKQIRAMVVRLGIEIRKKPGYGREGGWEWYLPGFEEEATETTTVEVAAVAREREVEATDLSGKEAALAGTQSEVDAAFETARQHVATQAQTPEVAVEVALPDAPAPAIEPNSQNRNSLENTAGNATTVVVASYATDRDVEATEVSPANRSLTGDDSGRDAAVEAALPHVSAKAQTTEVAVDTALPDAPAPANAPNSENRNSLENVGEKRGDDEGHEHVSLWMLAPREFFADGKFGGPLSRVKVCTAEDQA
ncbi:MAG: AAA family ATPase, partial [Planctomycetes bacterium]|nr:AAA family ATPase [Planctomycetota bacterium]